MFSSLFALTAADPVGRRGRPLAVHAVEQRRYAGADVADQRSDDLDVAVHLLGLDVDLDELLRSRLTPGLALAVRQKPVEAGADQHHDVGILQHRRARRARALRMRVGQQALGHAHRQERSAALLDQGADRIIGLRVGGALAEDDQGTLGALQDIERALDRGRSGNLGRCRVDDLDERLGSGLRVHHLREQLGRQIEIDAARTAGNGRADRARHADADVCGMQHAEGRLAQRLGDRQLVHLLVIALLQVDDLTLGRAADQNHRKAVGGGIGERAQTVEKAGSRHREADAGLLRQEAGDRRCVAGVLLMPERDDADAGGLGHAAEVRDRDAGHPVDRVDPVELERIDDEVKAIRQLSLRFGRRGFGLRLGRCLGHGQASLRVPGVSSDSPRNALHGQQARSRGRAPAPRHARCRAPPALR